MISKRKNIVIFFIATLFLFFNYVPGIRATGIHTFSLNDEGKYFIDYRDGLDPNTVHAFRNKIIKLMPVLEKWGGTSIDKLEIAIIPDSFGQYQAAYGDTDIWQTMGIIDKRGLDLIWAAARPQEKIIAIKEGALNKPPVNHEMCHLIEYPFEFDQYFSEGQADVCSLYIRQTLGLTYGPNDEDQLSGDQLKEAYAKLSPQERKIYGAKRITDVYSPFYETGQTFIEKLLAQAGTGDLSRLYMNLRRDFSGVAKKYQDYPIDLHLLTNHGQDILLELAFSFYSPAGQEVLMCESIKTYGDQVAAVFPEFGFPKPTNCEAKIKNYNQNQLAAYDDWMRWIRESKVSSGRVVTRRKRIVQATEPDKWKGSEVPKKENGQSELAVQILIITTSSLVVIIPAILGFALYHYIQKRKKNKTK
ncbi:MAG: hypothetical protein NTZ97_04415 [Candidatus Moranbacteria bacterium]|nr:hypothetical protein [Candidatus Moranbacteria bacterium]